MQRSTKSKQNNRPRIKKERIKIVRPSETKTVIVQKRSRPRRKQGYRRREINQVSVPASKGFSFIQTEGPRVKRSGNTCRISHREFVTYLNGTGGSDQGYVFYKMRINPGDSSSFQWLSLMSSSYTKYKIHSMRMRYIANCSTITEGSMIFYPEYNVQASDQLDINKILNSMDAITGSAWQSKTLPIYPRRFNQTDSFLLRNDLMSVDNYLLYDPLNIYIGSLGTGDAVALGAIFFEYDIELMVPNTEGQYNILSSGIQGTVPISATLQYPDLSRSTITNVLFGNYSPTYTTNGFQFTTAFYGFLMVSLTIGNGFDSSRPLLLNGGNGTIVYAKESDLDDTYLSGTDRWIGGFQIYAPPGGTLVWGGPLTSGDSGSTVTFGFYFTSSHPRWWSTPEPSFSTFDGSQPFKEKFPCIKVGENKRAIMKKERQKHNSTKKIVKILSNLLMDDKSDVVEDTFSDIEELD